MKIPIVGFSDRKEIVDFFTGAKSDSDQIDTAKRALTFVKKGGDE